MVQEQSWSRGQIGPRSDPTANKAVQNLDRQRRDQDATRSVDLQTVRALLAQDLQQWFAANRGRQVAVRQPGEPQHPHPECINTFTLVPKSMGRYTFQFNLECVFVGTRPKKPGDQHLMSYPDDTNLVFDLLVYVSSDWFELKLGIKSYCRDRVRRAVAKALLSSTSIPEIRQMSPRIQDEIIQVASSLPDVQIESGGGWYQLH